MTLDDIANDDAVAAGVWGMFSLFSGFKLFAVAVADPDFLTLISPLVATFCGSYIGWRHLQNLRSITEAKLKVHREIELAKIRAANCKPPCLKPNPATAKPDDDTVDMP